MSYETVKEMCPCQNYKSFSQKHIIDNTLNQYPPYYILGPSIYISDKPRYIFTFPDQNYINGGPPPRMNDTLTPWYGPS